MNNHSFGKGVFFVTTAYIIWGFLPVYWRILAVFSPTHLLGFRILFSLLFVSLALLKIKNFKWLKFYKDKQTRYYMILASLTVSFNWGLYIWAVNNGRTIEAALGYYINPLISIIFGLYFFKEKLKVLQIIAVCFAFIGVTVLTIFTGRFPWISLSLAIAFAIYSVLKKKVKLSALESLGAETLIAAPIAMTLLLASFGTEHGIQFTGFQGLSYILDLHIIILFLLLLSGPATSLPLYLFTIGTKILPFSTIGFIQFISPTFAFFTGLFIFKESFPARNFIAIGFIWVAVILYIISLRASPKLRASTKLRASPKLKPSVK